MFNHLRKSLPREHESGNIGKIRSHWKIRSNNCVTKFGKLGRIFTNYIGRFFTNNNGKILFLFLFG